MSDGCTDAARGYHSKPNSKKPFTKPEKFPAKATIICVDATGHLFALMEDGTIWERVWVKGDTKQWVQVEPIPQDTP